MAKITRGVIYSLDEKKTRFSEFQRQMAHITYGIVILISLLIYDKLLIGTILGSFVIIGGVISILVRRGQVKFLLDILDRFERPEVMEEFPGKGAFFFTFGCAITVLIFSKDIALAAIAILTFGDSSSHLLGAYIKKYKYSTEDKNKIKEGLFAGIIFASIAGAFFVEPFYAMIASVVVMIIEFIEFKVLKLDDNFYIPILSGGILFLLINFVM